MVRWLLRISCGKVGGGLTEAGPGATGLRSGLSLDFLGGFSMKVNRVKTDRDGEFTFRTSRVNAAGRMVFKQEIRRNGVRAVLRIRGEEMVDYVDYNNHDEVMRAIARGFAGRLGMPD